MTATLFPNTTLFGAEIERDLRVGQKTRAVSDVGGNGHLSLRRDTHRDLLIPVLAEADSCGDSQGGRSPNQCRGVTNRMGAGLMGARLEITRRDPTSAELRALSGRC